MKIDTEVPLMLRTRTKGKTREQAAARAGMRVPTARTYLRAATLPSGLHQRCDYPTRPNPFLASQLRWEEREREPHAGVLRLYTELLALRREHPALRATGRDALAVEAVGERALLLRRGAPGGQTLLAAINLGGALRLRLPHAGRQTLLDSEEPRYGGRGAARFEGEELVFVGAGAVVLV